MATSNPGNYDHLSDSDVIMESLVSFAPSNIPTLSKLVKYSVRDVISTFEWSESAKNNIDKISAIHKTSLIATLRFLNIKHNNKVLDVEKVKACEKTVIATLIHNKIMSMFPKFCSNCNSHYTIPFHDSHHDRRLYCHSCSTPSHDCYTRPYPIPPTKSPLVWLCDGCNHALSSTVIKHLHFSPSLSPDSVLESPHTTISSPIPSSPPPPPPPPPTIIPCPSPSERSLIPPAPISPTENPSPQPETPLSIPPTSVTNLPSLPAPCTQITPQLTPSTNNPAPKICHFLQKGICRYGANGQINGSCPMFHPRQCRAFLHHGTSDNGGCKKGKHCPLWHPTYLCRNSARYMECNRRQCNYRHHKSCLRPSPNPNPVSPFLRHAQPTQTPPLHPPQPNARYKPQNHVAPQMNPLCRTPPPFLYPSPPPHYPHQQPVPPLMSIPPTPPVPPQHYPYQHHYQNPVIQLQSLGKAINNLGQYFDNLVNQAHRLQTHF